MIITEQPKVNPLKGGTKEESVSSVSELFKIMDLLGDKYFESKSILININEQNKKKELTKFKNRLQNFKILSSYLEDVVNSELKELDNCVTTEVEESNNREEKEEDDICETSTGFDKGMNTSSRGHGHVAQKLASKNEARACSRESSEENFHQNGSEIPAMTYQEMVSDDDAQSRVTEMCQIGNEPKNGLSTKNIVQDEDSLMATAGIREEEVDEVSDKDNVSTVEEHRMDISQPTGEDNSDRDDDDEKIPTENGHSMLVTPTHNRTKDKIDHSKNDKKPAKKGEVVSLPTNADDNFSNTISSSDSIDSIYNMVGSLPASEDNSDDDDKMPEEDRHTKVISLTENRIGKNNEDEKEPAMKGNTMVISSSDSEDDVPGTSTDAVKLAKGKQGPAGIRNSVNLEGDEVVKEPDEVPGRIPFKMSDSDLEDFDKKRDEGNKEKDRIKEKLEKILDGENTKKKKDREEMQNDNDDKILAENEHIMVISPPTGEDNSDEGDNDVQMPNEDGHTEVILPTHSRIKEEVDLCKNDEEKKPAMKGDTMVISQPNNLDEEHFNNTVVILSSDSENDVPGTSTDAVKSADKSNKIQGLAGDSTGAYIKDIQNSVNEEGHKVADLKKSDEMPGRSLFKTSDSVVDEDLKMAEEEMNRMVERLKETISKNLDGKKKKMKIKKERDRKEKKNGESEKYIAKEKRRKKKRKKIKTDQDEAVDSMTPYPQTSDDDVDYKPAKSKVSRVASLQTSDEDEDESGTSNGTVKIAFKSKKRHRLQRVKRTRKSSGDISLSSNYSSESETMSYSDESSAEEIQKRIEALQDAMKGTGENKQDLADDEEDRIAERLLMQEAEEEEAESVFETSDSDFEDMKKKRDKLNQRSARKKKEQSDTNQEKKSLADSVDKQNEEKQSNNESKEEKNRKKRVHPLLQINISDSENEFQVAKKKKKPARKKNEDADCFMMTSEDSSDLPDTLQQELPAEGESNKRKVDDDMTEDRSYKKKRKRKRVNKMASNDSSGSDTEEQMSDEETAGTGTNVSSYSCKFGHLTIHC